MVDNKRNDLAKSSGNNELDLSEITDVQEKRA
jgi:hypothetical protein